MSLGHVWGARVALVFAFFFREDAFDLFGFGATADTSIQ